MKLVGENFSRNGHNIFKGIVKAVDDDGAAVGWADTVNLYNRKEKESLVTNLANDLSLAVDQVRGMVNALYRGLESEAQAASGLPDEEESKRSQSSTLIDLVNDAELWHTAEGIAYATIQVDQHRENWAIRAKSFKDWLAFHFFQREGKSPGGQAMADALTVLSGQALFEGPEHAIFVRIAETDGCIFLDLANKAWEVIKITPGGWGIIGDAPVRFRRPRGMLPLPKPASSGDLGLLRNLLNLASDDDWVLFLGCLVQALRGRGPYPVLVFYGEHGSAKSTAARVYRRLLDPNKADLRSPPRDERDLRIQATNGWIVGYDNLTVLQDWLSNALCRISTGGGMGTRELYADDEEVIFEGQRPIVLNGIEEISSRPDLVDRSVILLLKTITQRARRPEREFWRSFDEAHPYILAGLLDAVVAGTRLEASTHIDELPRMADFALWATACEPGLGLPAGRFLSAYIANRYEANSSAIEGSTIGPYIQEFITSIASGEWSGTATELLGRLVTLAPEDVRKQSSWPKRPNVLSGKLRALAPNLRAAGLEINQGRVQGRSNISLQLRRNPENTAAIATSPPTSNAGGGGGGDAGNEFQSNSKNYSDSKAPDIIP